LTRTPDTLPSARPAPPRQKGSQVGRYLLLDAIGAGGMGVVYSAYDPVLERKLALKLVRSETPNASEVTERLLREGKSIAQLAHPNIVAVFDMGTTEGRSMWRWSWSRRLAQGLAQGKTRRLARGARHLRRRGEGPRRRPPRWPGAPRLKPENVLVGNDGRVRVTDFGLALQHRRASQSRTEIPLATPGTSATGSPTTVRCSARRVHVPEQLEGRAAAPSPISSASASPSTRGSTEAGPGPPRASRGSGSSAGRPPNSKVPHWVRRAVERGLSLDPQARFPICPRCSDALGSDPDRAPSAPAPPHRHRGGRGRGAGRQHLVGSDARRSPLHRRARARGRGVEPGRRVEAAGAFEASGFDAAKANWLLSRAALDAYCRAGPPCTPRRAARRACSASSRISCSGCA